MAAKIVVQDGTATESVSGIKMQRFSYGQRNRVFEVTGAGDGNNGRFVQGTYWLEGTYTGIMLTGMAAISGEDDGVRTGALTISPGAMPISALSVNHTSVSVNGNFMLGGPAVVQVQFRGTVAV